MSNLSRERLRQLRRVAEGKCRWASCKGKVQQGETCEAHRAIINEANMRRYHENKGPVRRHKCSRCGERGHNVQRCPK